ncbi:MAG: ABC transporter permease [Chitinivibrionales bacterium]|nr:ABC transporter permease [Chitinivibrionales bacterium]
MLKYILRRLLFLIPVIIGVTFIVFSMLYLTPGDPAAMMLGDRASNPELLAMLRHKMGLDQPFLIQYFNYLKNMVIHLDIGRSYISNSPVIVEISRTYLITLRLAISAVIFAICVGIPAGIISAIKPYSLFDTFAMLFALIGVSMPIFWFGLLLILLFTVNLHWLPASGYESFNQMIMPMLALGLLSTAVIARMTRSSMLEVVNQDYIRTARAKGQKEYVVIFKHALGNALTPIITVAGLQFGALMGGAVLTESIFSIPGVGRLMVNAINSRDYPIVQGGVLAIAVSFCVINLLVDLLYAYVNPKIRSQYR